MPTTSADSQVGELLRGLREDRRLSVRTLAARSGFSPSFISQVENGQASPSIASLEKIAGALDVTLVEFFRAGENRSSVVVRADQRPRLESEWSKAAIENLGADASTRLASVLVTLRAGGSSAKRPHTLPREQFTFVVSGTLILELDGEQHLLGSGDAAIIVAHKPYRWVNSSSQPAQLLVVSHRTH